MVWRWLVAPFNELAEIFQKCQKTEEIYKKKGILLGVKLWGSLNVYHTQQKLKKL